METAEDQPTRAGWRSFWALVTMQFLQAFNVNAVKFILTGLGLLLVLLFKAPHGVEHIIAVALVVPYVLLAPTSGWLADRFAKNQVIRWTSWMQVGVVLLIAWALQQHHLWWAVGGFYLLSTQAALLSPAKLGVVKELVGGTKLGFASGVMEGTVIIAILAGQIIGANWFDARLDNNEIAAGYGAALGPMWWLVGLAVLAVVMAYVVQPSKIQSTTPFSWAMATSHVRDLKEMFRDRALRLCGIGVGFFWGFGGFILLVVLEIGEDIYGGGKGTIRTFANIWAMAVVGIAAGSVIAGLISRKRIELGLSPLGGVIMTLGTLALALTEAGSVMQKAMLILAGAGGAVFLVPLQAILQDRPAEDRRGAIISASNLLNNLFGIAAIALQFLLKFLHVPIAWQFVVLGTLTLSATIMAMRLVPHEVAKLLGLGLLHSFYRIKVTGAENIPAKGGVLIVPNHVTFADAFFLFAASPRRVRFVMDESFMTNRWIRLSAKWFHTVPIDRTKPRDALRIAADALKAGDVVCLFPEGQLTRTGTMNPLERGFELIARQAGCPVVPAYVDGSWGSMFSFAHGRFFSFPRKVPYRLSVAFGPVLLENTVAAAQAGILKASAAAVQAHVPEYGPVAMNAYQLSQTAAIPLSEVETVYTDDVIELAPALMVSAHRFGGDLSSRNGFANESASYWIGGGALRTMIETARIHRRVAFLDFSERALEPLDLPNVLHLPCLAIDGVIVSASMAHPAAGGGFSASQNGHKPASYGKLLPGFWVEHGRVFGAAAPAEGLPLPAGVLLDSEGFLSMLASSQPA